MRRRSAHGTRSLKRFARCESGAAALEFSIVAFAFIMVCLGTVEFGRGLQMRNELASAAGRGVRLVMVGANGEAATKAEVEAEIDETFRGAGGNDLSVVLGTTSVDGETYCTIQVSHPLLLQVPIVAGQEITLTVTRRVRPKTDATCPA